MIFCLRLYSNKFVLHIIVVGYKTAEYKELIREKREFYYAFSRLSIPIGIWNNSRDMCVDILQEKQILNILSK